MPITSEELKEEVVSITPDKEADKDLVHQFFPDAKVSETTETNGSPKKYQESPVFVWGLEANITSHEQLAEIISRVPEVAEEYTPIENFAPIDGVAWESHRNIIRTGGTKEDIGHVLAAWRFSFNQFERLYRKPTQENRFIEDYWDSKAMNYHRTMEMVLDPGKRDLLARLSGEETTAFSGISKIEQLLFDKSFEQREVLLEYLTYRLWVANNRVKMTSPYLGEEFGPSYQRNKGEYDKEREHLLPLVVRATREFAEEGNNHAVKKVLEKLETMEELEVATDLLTSEGLSDSARLVLAVQEMNVFGVVPTIESIASHSRNNEALTRLYKTLQGQDIQQVMTSLTEIYKSVDFHQYVLNNPELTTRELGIVQEQIQAFAERTGKTARQVRIIDVGAGTGRHAVPLHKLGYDVTALEYEQHHARKIKEQDPSIKVAVTDWHHMPFPDGNYFDDLSPEVFYCLGRTILHNNTPEKMANFFDEMQRVLTYNGVGIIDIPKIPEDRVSEVRDQYAEEITRYARHLESLGVEPGRTRNIFDGPDEKHKFNRMTMTDSQFRAYAKLFGFKVNKVEEAPIGDSNLFNNSYYIIEKDPDFVVDEIDPQEFSYAVASIGLLDPGIDYNRYVDAWGLPMGIPIMYMGGGQPDALWDMRESYRQGRLGEVRTQMENGTIYFEISHRPSRRY